MRAVLVAVLTMIFMTGCSELKIIGKAAIRELQCMDVIMDPLEREVTPEPAQPARPEVSRVMVAKAEPQFSFFRTRGEESKMTARMRNEPLRHGLWERGF